MVDNIKYTIYKGATDFASKFMGTLKDSKFLEKGVLTPEEFILAGEHLTHKCNTWKWESGKNNLINKNLPADKQYLVTKGVPCDRRIKDLQKFQSENAADLERDVDGGWVETTNPERKKDADDNVVDLDAMDDDKPMQVIGGDDKQEPKEEEMIDLDDMSDDDNMFAQPV